MKNLLNYYAVAILFLLVHCSEQKQKSSQDDLIRYVNPFIGTSEGGNLQPGAHLPFGMVHFSPVNNGDSFCEAANYIYKNPFIYGFGLLNISGTGCANYGSILIMPASGEPTVKKRYSKYSDEFAEPGYYSVMLDSQHIKTELTATLRAGFARFTFRKGKANIFIDLSRMGNQDTAFTLNIESDKEISGYRTDGQFCGKPGTNKEFFIIRFNKSFASSSLVKNDQILNQRIISVQKDKILALVSFELNKDDSIEVTAGVSFVSIANAKENLEKEIADKSFDQVRRDAKAIWNEKLSVILVEGGTDTDKIKFYTALYHTMSHPNILSDCNGEYPAMDTHKIMKTTDHNRYTIYSLWDTYRTFHPFMTLVYPEVQSEFVKSMLDMYKEYGWLPHWELNSVEKGVMNGDPSLTVISDTYFKGIKDFDTTLALDAMVHNTEKCYEKDEADRKNVQYIRKAKDEYNKNKGYITQDYKASGHDVWGVVSTTLEYNIADWNLSRYAKAMGREDLFKLYNERSHGYKFFYDSKTGFLRPRFADGHFIEPFDPLASTGEMSWPGSGGPGYTEGNAWHYLYFVPHDIKGLIELMGGEKNFTDKLQECFDKKIYNSSNEPDIAYPFLFNYVKGEEWRTQKTVRDLIYSEYRNRTDGVPGNDDCGTMSSWLLFAMMGIYPDCPGFPAYQLCSPIFDKITIKLNNKYDHGYTFVIETKNNSKENKYIKSISLNGKKYDKFSINHSDLVNGGKLLIELSNTK